VQVHVADREPRPGLAARLLSSDGRQKGVHVQRPGPAVPAGVGEVRPRLARAVGVQLDAVAVGVGEVDGLVGAVV
jgi:hypothetical protein